MKNILISISKISLLLITALDLTAAKAHAYIDPGAGSYAFQVALAGMAGLLVSSKLIFQKIRLFFLSRTGSSKEMQVDTKDSASVEK
jgi:hypothetical protein